METDYNRVWVEKTDENSQSLEMYNPHAPNDGE